MGVSAATAMRVGAQRGRRGAASEAAAAGILILLRRDVERGRGRVQIVKKGGKSCGGAVQATSEKLPTGKYYKVHIIYYCKSVTV